MLLSVCEPYAWYLVITCKNCGIRQPLHRDLSHGKSALLRSYTWRCIQCQHTAVYEANEIERYQHKVERRKTPRS
jgi:predicted nucleic-acid-binding Zn-ribbon protein